MELSTEYKRGEYAVQRVANLAVRNMNLPRNFEKGSWKLISKRRLFALLLVEVWELFKALYVLHRAMRVRSGLLDDFTDLPEYFTALALASQEVKEARSAVKHEAGDCVAFVAFIVDQI